MGFGGTRFLATLQAMYTGDNVTCQVAGVTTKPVYLTRGLRQVGLDVYMCSTSLIGMFTFAYAVRSLHF